LTIRRFGLVLLHFFTESFRLSAVRYAYPISLNQEGIKMIKPVLQMLCLGLLSGLLYGCGGDNSQLGDQSLIDDDDHKNPVACADIYAPVCSVELQNIQCITTPCPIGIHKTFPNRCESDAVRAKFLAEGKCGDLEGQPYFEDEGPVACTKEYKPVCGAVSITEPCDTIPCPAVVHRTFGNECEARAAKAHIIQAEECGKLEATPVTQLEGACPAVFDPVCGKDEGNIVCITEPCPTHGYKTFGNFCDARLALASVVLDDECGKLDGVPAFGQPPVKIAGELPAVQKEVSVSNVKIADDVLTLTLNYSGCSPQYLDLYISDMFMESNPVQVKARFKPMVEDLCLAYFGSEAAYDLIPLKHAYQRAYGTEHGEIVLQGIGSYSF
jgi:hypothetical protein